MYAIQSTVIFLFILLRTQLGSVSSTRCVEDHLSIAIPGCIFLKLYLCVDDKGYRTANLRTKPCASFADIQ